LIEIKNLSFKYANSKKNALNKITLKISDSEFILLAGPSGCGKSTLCRCINSLVPSFYGGKISGSVNVQNIDATHTQTKEMAKIVGMVFQDPENQLISTDVEREIAFGLENQGLPKTTISKRIEEVLDTIGIEQLRNRQISTLSGGEKQKIAIASVLVLQPEILVLDEPTSELDPKGAEEVIQLVKRLNEDFGLTVLLSEHRIDRVLQYVDRIIVMENSKISYDGNTREWIHHVGKTIPDIGVPPVTRLSVALQNKKIESKIPLTIKEGRQNFSKIFESNKFKKINYSSNGQYNNKPNIAIRAKDVVFKYPNSKIILNGINLNILKGEFVSIIGRNASGKTTLAKMFNGLLKPSKGNIEVNHINTKNISVENLSRYVGYVFQDPNVHLFADIVEEEITFMMQNLGFELKTIEDSLEKMLSNFDLNYCRYSYPRSLSTGEKQRVALSSILATRPQFLILDEPTRGLDYEMKRNLMFHLKSYQRDGGTIIFISHDIELIAEFGERILLLGEGKIIADGNKHEVLSNSLHFSPQINRLIQPFTKYGLSSDILTVDEIMKGFQ